MEEGQGMCYRRWKLVGELADERKIQDKISVMENGRIQKNMV